MEMPDGAAARAAINAMNGTYLKGRTLVVNEARPREDRGEGGGHRTIEVGLVARVKRAAEDVTDPERNTGRIEATKKLFNPMRHGAIEGLLRVSVRAALLR